MFFLKLTCLIIFNLQIHVGYRIQYPNNITFATDLGNLAKFGKIIRFSKYGVFAYYDHCDSKFLSVSLYLYSFPKKELHSKNCPIANFCQFGKILKNYKIFNVGCSCILQPLWSQVFVSFALSLTISEIRILLAHLPKFSKIKKKHKVWCTCILWALGSQISVRFALKQFPSFEFKFKIKFV